MIQVDDMGAIDSGEGGEGQKSEPFWIFWSLILSGVVTSRVGCAVIFIVMAMKVQAYRARRPKLSPLWQCLDAHFDAFVDIYPETYEHD